MKAAIVITGYLPYFRETYSNIFNRIFSQFEEYDVFLSTWNLSEIDEQDFKNLYNPVIIDNEIFSDTTKYTLKDNFKYLQSIPEHTSYGSSPHSIAMWYKLNRAFNIVEEYSSENNTHYDLILRLRTDFFYQNSISQEEINKCLNGLITVGVHCGDDIGMLNNGHAGDNFLMFKFDYLEFFKSLYFNFFKIWTQYHCYTPEHVLYSYLKDANCSFSQTSLRFVRIFEEKLLSWNINNQECVFNSMELLNIENEFYIDENYDINIS